MKIAIFVTLILVSAHTYATSLVSSYEFIPPTPKIEIKARAIVGRHIPKPPDIMMFNCGIVYLKKPPEVKFSLQYIGSRETWVPITGKVKKESFYRIY